MTKHELKAWLLLMGFSASLRTRDPTFVYILSGEKYKWITVRFKGIPKGRSKGRSKTINIQYSESNNADARHYSNYTPQAAFDYIKEKLT